MLPSLSVISNTLIISSASISMVLNFSAEPIASVLVLTVPEYAFTVFLSWNTEGKFVPESIVVMVTSVWSYELLNLKSID